jgi:hypothetical protein
MWWCDGVASHTEDMAMSAQIASDHPIREMFSGFVERAFQYQLGMNDPQVNRYLADVLVDFTHRDNLFRLKDVQGARLEQVGEMLAEGDVSLNATSFEREREVHKHIGDFTLFWTGVYPEMLRYFRAAARADHLVDYVEQGRKSYKIASTFQHGPFAEEAPVLRQLSDEFEKCMYGLHLVRVELETYGTPQMKAVRKLLEA